MQIDSEGNVVTSPPPVQAPLQDQTQVDTGYVQTVDQSVPLDTPVYEDQPQTLVTSQIPEVQQVATQIENPQPVYDPSTGETLNPGDAGYPTNQPAVDTTIDTPVAPNNIPPTLPADVEAQGAMMLADAIGGDSKPSDFIGATPADVSQYNYQGGVNLAAAIWGGVTPAELLASGYHPEDIANAVKTTQDGSFLNYLKNAKTDAETENSLYDSWTSTHTGGAAAAAASYALSGGQAVVGGIVSYPIQVIHSGYETATGNYDTLTPSEQFNLGFAIGSLGTVGVKGAVDSGLASKIATGERGSIGIVDPTTQKIMDLMDKSGNTVEAPPAEPITTPKLPPGVGTEMPVKGAVDSGLASKIVTSERGSIGYTTVEAPPAEPITTPKLPPGVGTEMPVEMPDLGGTSGGDIGTTAPMPKVAPPLPDQPNPSPDIPGFTPPVKVPIDPYVKPYQPDAPIPDANPVPVKTPNPLPETAPYTPGEPIPGEPTIVPEKPAPIEPTKPYVPGEPMPGEPITTPEHPTPETPVEPSPVEPAKPYVPEPEPVTIPQITPEPITEPNPYIDPYVVPEPTPGPTPYEIPTTNPEITPVTNPNTTTVTSPSTTTVTDNTTLTDTNTSNGTSPITGGTPSTGGGGGTDTPPYTPPPPTPPYVPTPTPPEPTPVPPPIPPVIPPPTPTPPKNIKLGALGGLGGGTGGATKPPPNLQKQLAYLRRKSRVPSLKVFMPDPFKSKKAVKQSGISYISSTVDKGFSLKSGASVNKPSYMGRPIHYGYKD